MRRERRILGLRLDQRLSVADRRAAAAEERIASRRRGHEARVDVAAASGAASQGRLPMLRARCASRSAEASSIQWTSSKTSSAGPGSRRASSSAATSSSRARRKRVLEAGRPRASRAARRRRGGPSSGSHGESSGRAVSDAPAEALHDPRRKLFAADAERRPARRAGTGSRGWTTRTARKRRRSSSISPACRRSSSTSRDLPIPGSPISSTRRPRPSLADASASSRAAISSSRPTSGSSCRACSLAARSPARSRMPRPAGPFP